MTAELEKMTVNKVLQLGDWERNKLLDTKEGRYLVRLTIITEWFETILPVMIEDVRTLHTPRPDDLAPYQRSKSVQLPTKTFGVPYARTDGLINHSNELVSTCNCAPYFLYTDGSMKGYAHGHHYLSNRFKRHNNAKNKTAAETGRLDFELGSMAEPRNYIQRGRTKITLIDDVFGDRTTGPGSAHLSFGVKDGKPSFELVIDSLGHAIPPIQIQTSEFLPNSVKICDQVYVDDGGGILSLTGCEKGKPQITNYLRGNLFEFVFSAARRLLDAEKEISNYLEELYTFRLTDY